MTIVDDALAVWHAPNEGKRKSRELGAKMYFVRLQMAHIFEALSIVKHIADTPALSSAIGACDVRTRGSFKKVCDFIATDDYKAMLRIRNNVTFHYDDKVVDRALSAAANKHPDYPLTLSWGQSTIDWHFQPGDLIVDRAIVRDIFKLPEGADVRVEIDKIVVRLQEIGAAFADFAGYFIWHYTKK